MNLPDEFKLEKPSIYFSSENDPKAVAFVEARNYLHERMENGTLYIKFVKGDRAGSIAKVKLDGEQPKARIYLRPRYYSRDNDVWEIDRPYMYGVATWDKRKNSCKVNLPSYDDEIVFLPNYEGPTIYQMFDKKAAKENVLKNPKQKDIDGNLLQIGDEVLYINARYGSGFQLCHGTIQEFKAVVDSKKTVITTIVKNADEDEVSSINDPQSMIWKKA